MAFVYRKEGPQRRKYSWELEEEDEEIEAGDASEASKDDDEEAYWKSNIS
jgi:hypothetical protein